MNASEWAFPLSGYRGLAKIAYILLAILLVSGCATAPQPQVEPPKEPPAQDRCRTKRSTIGIFLKESKAHDLEISNIRKDSPAAKSQLRQGDVLLKINGIPIKSRYDFLKRLDEIPPGRSVELTVKRKSGVLEKTVLVEEGFIYHDAKAIQSLLASGMALRLAILVVNVNNALVTSNDKPTYEKWQSRTRAEIFSTLTSELLNTYHGEKNLIMTDRTKAEQILQDVPIQQTGFVSENEKTKLIHVHNVTHLLLVDFTLQKPSHPYLKYTYVESRKLMDLKTGKTLAAVTCTGGQ